MTNRISISQLQDNPSKYIHACHTKPVELTNHGKTVGYIVSPVDINVQNLYSMSASLLRGQTPPSSNTNVTPQGGTDEQNHNHS